MSQSSSHKLTRFNLRDTTLAMMANVAKTKVTTLVMIRVDDLFAVRSIPAGGGGNIIFCEILSRSHVLCID